MVSSIIRALLCAIQSNQEGRIMTKAELVARMAEKAKLTKAQAESALAVF